METTEIMDLAMRVYQTFGLVLLRAAAVPALFCFAALTFWTQFVLPSLTVTSNAGNINAQIGEAMMSISLGVAVGGPLFLIGLSYASGVTVHLVADFIGGRLPNEEGAHAGARRAIGRMFWLNVRELVQAWSGIIIAFGALAASAMLSEVLSTQSLWSIVVALVAIFGFLIGLFVLPWVMARHALAPAAIVLEGKRPGEAVRRSIDLMKGTPWTPSGFGTVILLFFVELLLLFLIWMGASTSLGLFEVFDQARALADWPLVGTLLLKALELFPLFLAVWIIIPVWCTTTTILYYERRIRLEGYDILALAQEVWRVDRQSRFEL